MKNIKVWSGLILIFISGAAVGSVASTFVMKHRVMGFIRGGPPHAHRRIIREVTEGIDLTDEQRRKIDLILDESIPEMEKLSEEFGKTMEFQTERQMEKIREILTDDQRIAFNENLGELKERFRSMRGRRRPGGRSGGRHGDHREPPDSI